MVEWVLDAHPDGPRVAGYSRMTSPKALGTSMGGVDAPFQRTPRKVGSCQLGEYKGGMPASLYANSANTNFQA